MTETERRDRIKGKINEYLQNHTEEEMTKKQVKRYAKKRRSWKRRER